MEQKQQMNRNLEKTKNSEPIVGEKENNGDRMQVVRVKVLLLTASVRDLLRQKTEIQL